MRNVPHKLVSISETRAGDPTKDSRPVSEEGEGSR